MFFPKIQKRQLFSLPLHFFSTLPSSQFNFKLDVYPSDSIPKRFYLPSKSSVFSVENLIKSGDSSLKTVDFSANEGTMDKSSIFLDSALKTNLKLLLNSKAIAYKIDDFHDLGYFTNSNFDAVFKQKEVPFPQVAIFSSVFKAYETRFAKTQKDSFPAKELQENLVQVLKDFGELNQITAKELENNLEKCLKDLASEKNLVQTLEEKINAEARKTLKFWLLVTTVQFFLMFYICYYVYGWDVAEPIGYLIGLGLETAAIGFFLRFRAELGQNALFANKLKKLKKGTTSITKPNKGFLAEKANFFKRNLSYGKI